MGFCRKSPASVKDSLAESARHFKDAAVSAGGQARDAATPRVQMVVNKLGVPRKKKTNWPAVAAAVSIGAVLAGAVTYLAYRRRTERIGEQLLADEILDDTGSWDRVDASGAENDAEEEVPSEAK
ncbi:hypothetical protein [Salininema proteolyticum]|uniref:Uncharacterized protein n=1 Tax=Salininema proteolyticum TaxID=1607685 RepID=A0ABV8TVQ7_9ACTN